MRKVLSVANKTKKKMKRKIYGLITFKNDSLLYDMCNIKKHINI